MAHPYVLSQGGLVCLPTQSGQLDRTIGQQLSSGTDICSSVQGGTGEALPEPYRMTSSSVHVSDQIVRIRVHEGGIKARCPVVGHVLAAQHSAAGLAFTRVHQNWQVHHWHPVLFTVSTCNSLEMPLGMLSGLKHHPAWLVWQWVSGGLGWNILGGPHRPPRVSQWCPLLLLGTGMKSSEPLSDLMLQWALGSSWCMTMPGLMWPECISNQFLDDEGIDAFTFPRPQSTENLWDLYQSTEMQTGNGEKVENIAWIGGLRHMEFILKIFALHAHL